MILKKLLFIILFPCIFIFSFSCKNTKVTTYTKSKILFGTVVNITICSENAENNIDVLFKNLQHYNDIFNIYNQNSLISQLNTKINIITNEKCLYDILFLSKYFGKLTNGAFDITIEPLVKLYKKYRLKKLIPPYKFIKQTLKYVNYKNIHIKKINDKQFRISLAPNTSIDLGGVAKGYAVEKASELLKGKKVKYAIIDAGGNIKVIGKLPNNKKWLIGIQHPRKINNIIKNIHIMPGDSVSTSGDYFRYFIYKGKRCHHILDPKTGYPANKCQSVTVVGKNSAITDILSTAIFVLGPQKVKALTNKTNKYFPKDNYRIYIIDNKGKLLRFIL